MSWNRIAIIGALALFACVQVANANDVQSKPAKPCAAPVYRQFDFFAGDWDAYDVGAPDKIVARNKVGVILDGCVAHEDYHQDDGLHGESYSLYDSSTGMWHQSWVTNHGELLLLDGGLQNGMMIFTGNQKTKDGKPSLLRGVWIPQGKTVRETATRSTDGGKTWQPVFDIVFKPHREH